VQKETVAVFPSMVKSQFSERDWVQSTRPLDKTVTVIPEGRTENLRVNVLQVCGGGTQREVLLETVPLPQGREVSLQYLPYEPALQTQKGTAVAAIGA